MEGSVGFNPPIPLSIEKLPVLKKGELATDGTYLYLCGENGEIQIFVNEEISILAIDSVFDQHINQMH